MSCGLYVTTWRLICNLHRYVHWCIERSAYCILPGLHTVLTGPSSMLCWKSPLNHICTEIHCDIRCEGSVTVESKLTVKHLKVSLQLALVQLQKKSCEVLSFALSSSRLRGVVCSGSTMYSPHWGVPLTAVSWPPSCLFWWLKPGGLMWLGCGACCFWLFCLWQSACAQQVEQL